MIRRFTLYMLCLALAGVHGHAAAEQPTRPPTTVVFTADLPTEGSLVLGVFAGNELGPLGQEIDANADGALTRAIEALEFEAEASTSQLVAAPRGSGLQRILLVGLGERLAPKSALEWQTIGGNAVQAAIAAFKTAPPLAFDAPADNTADLAFGAKLGSYYFDRYITDGERIRSQGELTVVTSAADAVQDIYRQALDPVADAMWLTRDASNEPANLLYPESFVATWQGHFKALDRVKLRVLDERDMRKQGMGAIYGVGQGSARPPRILIVEYSGGRAGDAPIVIVGKGITFDTGGISIKSAKNLWNMKFDMSGAASTMGTLYALAARGARVNAVGIAALAENMPGSNAQRPGDIVSTLSGKQIEIRNTDAEGRLVLADAIHYGDITYDPVLLVDLATLTGSAARALGNNYAALLTRHDELVPDFLAAGELSGDRVWEMPLDDEHFEAIESNVADVINSGAEGPGLSTAAAFIGTFVREQTPWVHFDIAGVAYSDEPAPLKASPGSTSFGVRLLDTYIRERFETH